MESRILVRVPSEFPWNGHGRSSGRIYSPLSSTSSKSVTEISESCNRSWKATRDPCDPLLYLGILLCFLIAWHWLTQHPGERFTLQSTEASWDRNTTMYFFTSCEVKQYLAHGICKCLRPLCPAASLDHREGWDRDGKDVTESSLLQPWHCYTRSLERRSPPEQNEVWLFLQL